ncbi:MAG: polysaccharide pyruvyl transferase family protein [Agathobacter sp.]
MALIDELMSKESCDYEFYLPNSGYNDRQKHSIRFGDKTIGYYDIGYPFGTGFTDTLLSWCKMVIKHDFGSFKIFKNADYILDIGQGDSFADIYGKGRFLWIDQIHKLARLYHKPYCLLPQTIGPFENEKIREKAIKSIKKASLCMARDKQSLDYVVANVPQQKNVCECIDVAFFLPYETIKQDASYVHVGINISALLWHGGYTRNNQFGLKCEYQSLVRQLIDYFLNQNNVKVHLVPHVVGGERTVENDYAVSYDLWREYNNPNLILAPLALGPIEIKSYIAGLDFFMGARMHATIGAFSAGVPVVPMAYSRKFNGLFLDTLSYNHMVDMKTMDNDEILKTIKSAFDNLDVLKKEIECQMDTTVKEKKQLIMNKLKDFFNLQ